MILHFRFSAYGAGGQIVRDTVSAVSEADVLRLLSRDGLMPFEIEVVETGPRQKTRRRKRISTTALTGFCRSMASMVDGGLPVDEALQLVASDQEDRAAATLAAAVREEVIAGMSLADALARIQPSPPDYLIGLVRAGEAGSSLGPVFRRLGVALDNERRLSDGVKSALIYPAVLGVTALASVGLILLVVAPALKPVLTVSGAEAPAAARALIGASDLLRQGWIWGLMALLAMFLGMSTWSHSDKGRNRLGAWILKLPFVGRTILDMEVARFAATLSALLENGVSIVPALSIARQGIGNPMVDASMEPLIDTVREGGRLSATLLKNELIPPIVAQLAAVGERSGELPAQLMQAAGVLEDRSRRRVDRMTALAAPVLTLVLGVMIGAVVLTLLTAIMSVNDLAA
jgi:general secretion pathway protein F